MQMAIHNPLRFEWLLQRQRRGLMTLEMILDASEKWARETGREYKETSDQ